MGHSRLQRTRKRLPTLHGAYRATQFAANGNVTEFVGIIQDGGHGMNPLIGLAHWWPEMAGLV
jgi:hypothetical protein